MHKTRLRLPRRLKEKQCEGGPPQANKRARIPFPSSHGSKSYIDLSVSLSGSLALGSSSKLYSPQYTSSAVGMDHLGTRISDSSLLKCLRSYPTWPVNPLGSVPRRLSTAYQAATANFSRQYSIMVSSLTFSFTPSLPFCHSHPHPLPPPTRLLAPPFT